MYTISEKYKMPDENGFFGEFGGMLVTEAHKKVMRDLEAAFNKYFYDENFRKEVYDLLQEFSGRPTPLYFAKKLTEHYGTGKIYIKREDLNHTGSHKINNVIGQALLAKKMGATKVIAETGAGQHGVASATAAALLGLECTVFMGAKDILRQKSNVDRMRLLGAKVVSVESGEKTLKDACDAASDYWLAHPDEVFYIIGSTVGAHPYPMMVRFFQSIISAEMKAQILEKEGRLPDYVLACVGGGSNAAGSFYNFIEHPEVNLIGLEAAGLGIETSKHCASITQGKKMQMHGKIQYVITDKEGNVLNSSYSIAAGLDYPGVGPEHCYLSDSGRAKYYPITDEEAIRAFGLLSKTEGIVPAIESSHAVAYLEKLMPVLTKDQIVIVNLSGRGDKDTERLLEHFV